ncbi:hypothetical protein E2C01_069753 [Portunus trituberculatus]|uniref:Uncharacterized protein n=1 Tax=Portunus trituberculatus TaxID=210409 RepID=A0A5B7I1N6_PORTR|nr:hypothetical protein [Portunus trituberculatus]
MWEEVEEEEDVTGIFRLNNLLRQSVMGANGVVAALSGSGEVTFPSRLTTCGCFKVTGVTEGIKQSLGGGWISSPRRAPPLCLLSISSLNVFHANAKSNLHSFKISLATEQLALPRPITAYGSPAPSLLPAHPSSLTRHT